MVVFPWRILKTYPCTVKAMVSPVAMYWCESWTIRRLSTKELMLSNCGVGEDSWESLNCKEIQPVHLKGNQPWIFIGRTDAEAEGTNTLATWCKELTHWKRPWCWERLRAGREGGARRWDGWCQLNGHEFEQTLGDSEGRKAWHAAVHGVAKSQTWFTDWTTITTTPMKHY